MKSLLALSVVLMASGCVSKATIGNQLDELKALDAYHSAERKAEKAEQAVVVSTAALAASVLKKAEADKEVKETKLQLTEVLGK